MDEKHNQELVEIKQDIIKNKDQIVPAKSLDQRNIPTPPTCDYFKEFKVVRGTEESFKIFQDFAQGKTEKYMLLCYGTTGSGKTHLMLALSQSLNCNYYTWHDVIRMLKRKMSDKTPPFYDMILDNYCRAQKLILDDIGMGTMDSQWENSVLEEIIDERYRNRLFTAATTNKDIKTLPERVVSRFRDAATSVIVVNRGVDYRPLKGK